MADPRGANRAAPMSPTYSGWFNDRKDNRLVMYYNGTAIGYLDATGFVSTGGSAGGITPSSLIPRAKTSTVRLGTTAAIASNGANAILPDVGWVVPTSYTNGVLIVEAYKMNMTASDVTTGTATSSASFRRYNLITNTAGTGSGTSIVASLNATASAASAATRAFTSVASTVPAGAVVLLSHLTVGAATADGTDGAASIFELAYYPL